MAGYQLLEPMTCSGWLTVWALVSKGAQSRLWLSLFLPKITASTISHCYYYTPHCSNWSPPIFFKALFLSLLTPLPPPPRV